MPASRGIYGRLLLFKVSCKFQIERSREKVNLKTIKMNFKAFSMFAFIASVCISFGSCRIIFEDGVYEQPGKLYDCN